MTLFVQGPDRMCDPSSPPTPPLPLAPLVDGRRRDKASSSSSADSGSADSGYQTGYQSQWYNVSSGTADTEDYAYVECWRSWWFFRTLFQSFGEIANVFDLVRVGTAEY